MKKFDVITFAFKNFFRRKTRSFLTVLGVVIGTIAVVIMLSIGIGMNAGIEASYAQNQNLREIYIYPDWRGDSTVQITDQTIADIKNIENINAVSPIMNSWGMIINGKEVSNCSLMGIDPSQMEGLEIKLSDGRLLTADDIGEFNIVMSYSLPYLFYNPRDRNADPWREILASEVQPHNPLETEYKFTMNWSYGSGPVTPESRRYKVYNLNVVGVLERQTWTSVDWYTGEEREVISSSNEVYIDIALLRKIQDDYNKAQQQASSEYYASSGMVYSDSAKSSTAQTKDNEIVYDNLRVVVNDKKNVAAVVSEIQKLGLYTSNSLEWVEQIKEQMKFLQYILGAIGAVSFLVAALSIANTMIMSIYERTREIGIMKVMGCLLGDIRGMFLLEAAIIGFFGGIIGIGLSYAVSHAVNVLAAGGGVGILGSFSGVGTNLSLIPFWLSLVALIMSTFVGIVSGFYPAMRATRLSALEALKNE